MCTPVLSVRTLSRLIDDAMDNTAILPLIAQLAGTRKLAAIAVLASLLDSAGSVGDAAVHALIGFGDAVIPAMRECLDAMDEDMIRNAHRVLAALGDVDSARAQYAHCWDDLETGHAPRAGEIVAHLVGRKAA
jgi:hypothetical protein